MTHMGIKYPCFVPGCPSIVSRKDSVIFHLKRAHILRNDELEEHRKKVEDFHLKKMQELKISNPEIFQ
jgi:hypothetical protein